MRRVQEPESKPVGDTYRVEPAARAESCAGSKKNSRKPALVIAETTRDRLGCTFTDHLPITRPRARQSAIPQSNRWPRACSRLPVDVKEPPSRLARVGLVAALVAARRSTPDSVIRYCSLVDRNSQLRCNGDWPGRLTSEVAGAGLHETQLLLEVVHPLKHQNMRRKTMRLSSRFVAIGVALAILLPGVATWALAQGGGGTIYACVNDHSGEVKIVGADDPCGPNETPRSWSVVGQQGEQGPPGETGPVVVPDVQVVVEGVVGPPGPVGRPDRRDRRATRVHRGRRLASTSGQGPQATSPMPTVTPAITWSAGATS